jgi:hypothetical protein
VPWWGAVIIAVVGTCIGFAYDAGSGTQSLGGVFAAMYFLGCVAAVLAVRQDGIFTAVVQPPLILFVAVPTTYYLFNHANIDGIKDILINCGYPLIERFLLMFTTAVVVLLIGMARWYFGAAQKPATETASATSTASVAAVGAGLLGVLGAVKAKLTAFAESRATDPESRKHAIDRDSVTEPTRRRRTRAARPAQRPAASRSRHVRPPAADGAEPVRPSRRRPTHAREFDDLDEAPPRRRAPRDPNRRTPPPEYRREPRQPRPPRPRPPYEPYEPREPRDPFDRYERPRPRPDRYAPLDEPYPADPYEPRRRRPPAGGSGSTHIPYSNVRYRGSADDGDAHAQYRSAPRHRVED